MTRPKMSLSEYVDRVAVASVLNDKRIFKFLLDEFIVDDFEAVQKAHKPAQVVPDGLIGLKPP